MSTYSPMVSVRNNVQQLRKISYFKEKGKILKVAKRTGSPGSKFLINKNSYALSQERKKLMFKKGMKVALIVVIGFALLAALSVSLLS